MFRISVPGVANRYTEQIMKTKALFTLSLGIMLLLLSSCGGQKERNKDIPTKEEAVSFVEDEMGIKGASVLSMQDVRNKGAEYHDIDAVYTMTGDRGKEFTLLRSCSYDSLFGTGYFYGWTDDYSDVIIQDYLSDHPMPEGIYYSEGPYPRYEYGAREFFGNTRNVIWFEFADDEEFEEYLDALEPWLNEWLSHERQYLFEGKDPILRVTAYRPQDESMRSIIQVVREFGHDNDSFHFIGADGETYRWSSFRKAMDKGYGSQKKLMMK